MTGSILPGNGKDFESTATVGTLHVYTLTATQPATGGFGRKLECDPQPGDTGFWKSDMVNGYQMINLRGLTEIFQS